MSKLACYECPKFTGTNVHCYQNCIKLAASLNRVQPPGEYPPTYGDQGPARNPGLSNGPTLRQMAATSIPSDAGFMA